MRNAKWIFLAPLLLMLACSSPSVDEEGTRRVAAEKAFYSETHLPFEKWKRGSQCCTASGKEAAVASGGTHSSKIGLEILDGGGNVVDAAVAVSFALCVERQQSLGIGGGGFMTLHLSDEGGKDFFVDFRETAPAKATRNMYLDASGKIIPKLSTEGGLAVATPGMVAGLYDIHKKWGRLPWRKVVEPSVRLAREGFPVYVSLAASIAKQEWMDKSADAKKTYFIAGKRLVVGDRLKQPELAKTLQLIARQGKAGFYQGALAQKMVKAVKERRGILELSDLKSYQVKFREPMKGKFRDLVIVSAPPPSAGGVLLAQMLGVLEGFPLEKDLPALTPYLHLLAEVMKRGYADRSDFIGDSDFVKTPFRRLVAPEYLEALKKKINLGRATPAAEIRPGSELKPESSGTSQVSIIDNEGNAVSATLTVNNSFGADFIVPGTGIVMNNEMDDFSAKPGEPNLYGLTGSEANAIEPGKRPVSSMSPTIVLRGGEPVLAVGAGGGSRIISSVLQTILNDVVVYPQDVKKAVFAPRLHHQWVPDKLDLESSYPTEVVEALKKLGHELVPPGWDANVFAVQRDATGVLTAVFDPRDEGGAAAQ